MSNVTSIFGGNNHSIFGGYGPADFEVASVPLMYFDDNDGWHPSSKIAVVRTDTMQELGVHGSKYKPVAPKELIDAQRAIILRSDLNTDGIREDIQTSHCGSRTFVKYTLPNHTYQTPDGDQASLALLGITSFDSSWPFMMSVAAHQFACLNLQVFSSGEITVFKARHTQNLDIDHGSRVIVKAMELFENEQETWRLWSNTKISEQAAMYTFAEASGCLKQVKLLVDSGASSWADVFDGLARFNSALNYMWLKWGDYKSRMGANKWAVYNTLTDWSTHAPAARAATQVNIASVSHKRQEVVRKTLNSEVFKFAA
jgi:hypothetical protein